MSEDVVSLSKIFVDGPEIGSKQLLRVKSIKESDDQDTVVVTAVGVSGGAGFQDKPGGGGFDLEVYREKIKPEVDWRKAKRDKWRFALTLADDDGERNQYPACRVAQVSGDSDDGGSNMMTVKLVHLGIKPLPKVV